MGCRGGLQGARRRDEACTRASGANAKRGAPEAALGVSRHSGAGAAWLLFRPLSLHPPRAWSVFPGVGRRASHSSPPPSPTQHRPGGLRFQAGRRHRAGPRSLAESLCSQPSLHPQPGSWKSLGRRMLPNRKHELRTPAPTAPPGSFPASLPTPTPGMVLSTADQDFMVQKPPEGKGRRATGGPRPRHTGCLALCARWEGLATEGQGLPGRDGQLLLYISNPGPGARTRPAPACGARGTGGYRGSCVSRLTSPEGGLSGC